jgi:hypothetical protein
VTPVLVGYGVLALFQAGEMQLQSVVTDSALVKSFGDWRAEDMPDHIGPWARQGESTFESRDRDNPYGAHSRTWRYQTKSGLTAVVSFDYPFPDWHDLRWCYNAIGWRQDRTDKFTHPVKVKVGATARDENLECIWFDLSKGLVNHGYCWFTEFDPAGRPVPIRDWESEWAAKGYAGNRWADRFSAMRDRWLSVFGLAQAQPPAYDVLQVQVLIETYGSLAPADKEEAQKFFVQAAELIRGKCAAAAAAK